MSRDILPIPFSFVDCNIHKWKGFGHSQNKEREHTWEQRNNKLNTQTVFSLSLNKQRFSIQSSLTKVLSTKFSNKDSLYNVL